jgi:hypothetical protein
MIRRMLLGLVLMAFVVQGKEKLVSLTVDDVPVAQVLQAIATLGERNIVIAPDRQRARYHCS